MSSDPVGCTYQSSDPVGYTYQPSDPVDTHINLAIPKDTQQSSDPEGHHACKEKEMAGVGLDKDRSGGWVLRGRGGRRMKRDSDGSG
ncbi:NBS-LRR type resistance protein [Cucumis melo var. makuwa]|uniref:NBS-LRR type resistance protein n=1 Tax=Cucumis melo var. makuwa TaxID=1194695 RepID=A0A5D3CCC0_CUCMM|nr:NBS-LRR type resistance protein [Cucumis melo var. makuwa]